MKRPEVSLLRRSSRTLPARWALWVAAATTALGVGLLHDQRVRGAEHGEHEGHEEGDKHEGHGEEGVVVLSEAKAQAAGIEVAPVERRVVPFSLETTASVDFDERRLAHVGPRIPGRVHEVLVDLGDSVTTGQPLATLDSIELAQARADYLVAKAEADLAAKTLRRQRKLRKARIVSEQAVVEAEADYLRARARLRGAREKLRLLGLSDWEIDGVRYGDPNAAHFRLTAPIDGTVVARHLVTGELVSPSDRVFTIADLSRVWVWVDVYERDLPHVHVGDVATIRTEGVPGEVFKGKVTYLSAIVDTDTRAARARVEVDNPDQLLRAGMFARVIVDDVHAGASRPVLAVPVASLVRMPQGHAVFVEEAPRRYRLTPVHVERRTTQWAVIATGLAEGARVVTRGTFLLKSELQREHLGGGHHH